MNKSKWASTVAVVMVLMGCTSTNNVSINQSKGQPSELTVAIMGVSSEAGRMLVFLHDNSESYYADDNADDPKAKYFRKLDIKPTVPVTTAVFAEVPAGRYAIIVVHDKDGDGGLDRMIFPFLGMPSEPYALSNNVYNNFSKGDFDDALITLQAPRTQVELQLATHLSKMTGL